MTNKSPQELFVFLAPDLDLRSLKSSHPVASWFSQLFKSCREINLPYKLISYQSMPSFPRARLLVLPTSHSILDQTILLPYVNLKYVRFAILSFFASFLLLFISLVNFRSRIKVFYWNNNSPFSLVTLLRILPWVHISGIIADGPALPLFKADSLFYLSYFAYCRSTASHKYFLQTPPFPFIHEDSLAAADLMKISDRFCFAGKYVIVYSGSLNMWSGIEHFFASLDSPHIIGSNLLFVVTSRETPSTSQSRLFESPFILFLGNLSTSDLYHIYCRSNAFLITRSLTSADCFSSYPSKIMHYITCEKPIFSVPLLSYPDSHNSFLLYCDDVSSLGFIYSSLDFMSKSKDTILAQKYFMSKNSWNAALRTLFN